jgi:hypothetical protein
MSKIYWGLIDLVLYLWQLPQNLLGKIIFIIHRKNILKIGIMRKPYPSPIVSFYLTPAKHGGAISLGKYIFIFSERMYRNDVINHEYGHCRQSLYLGWLYLPIIGLQSILWAALGQPLRKKYGISYYWFWTEKWADKLGGVKR